MLNSYTKETNTQNSEGRDCVEIEQLVDSQVKAMNSKTESFRYKKQ